MANLFKRLSRKNSSDDNRPQHITVRLKGHDLILAEGDEGEGVLFNEGAYYFIESLVNLDVLKQAERSDTCTLQGRNYWYDVALPSGEVVENIGWKFYSLKPGYEMLLERYGFPHYGLPAIEIDKSPIVP